MDNNTGQRDAREQRPLRGIALTVLGIGCITFNDAMMKLVVDDHPPAQAICVRGVFALVPIAFIVWRSGGWQTLRIHSVRAQALCALLLAVPLFLYIWSLSHLPLSVATILSFTNPLFVTIMAPVFIGERVTWSRWLAVLTGFAGAVLVVRPEDGGFSGAGFNVILLAPVLVAWLSGVRELVVRTVIARETSVSLLFYSSVAVTAIALASIPFGWAPLAWTDVALLVAAAVGFGFGIWLMTEGLRFAEASLLSVFKYSAIVWALALGFALWGETPGLGVVAGTALVIASGLFVLRRTG